MLSSKTMGIAFWAVLVLVGMLGLIPSPIVSAEAIFKANGLNNLVHFLTGSPFSSEAWSWKGEKS